MTLHLVMRVKIATAGVQCFSLYKLVCVTVVRRKMTT